MPYVWADRSDFKTVLEKIAQCFPSGITQFLNQHTSKYQKRSKHFVCTRLPGSSMFCIGWQPDYIGQFYFRAEKVILFARNRLSALIVLIFAHDMQIQVAHALCKQGCRLISYTADIRLVTIATCYNCPRSPLHLKNFFYMCSANKKH